jgi:hypothetical protein
MKYSVAALILSGQVSNVNSVAGHTVSAKVNRDVPIVKYRCLDFPVDEG